MTAVTGDNDKRHLFRNITYFYHSLLIHHHTVIDIVPQPGEELIPDLDEHFVVIRGNFTKVALGVFYDARITRFSIGRHILHESDEVLVIEDHPDEFIPGFQNRSHNGRFLIIDAVNQFPPQTLHHLPGIEAFIFFHEISKIDGFRRDHDGVIGITEEGDNPLQGVRVVRLPEQDINQILLFLLPPASIGYELRNYINRNLHIFLGI